MGDMEDGGMEEDTGAIMDTEMEAEEAVTEGEEVEAAPALDLDQEHLPPRRILTTAGITVDIMEDGPIMAVITDTVMEMEMEAEVEVPALDRVLVLAQVPEDAK